MVLMVNKQTLRDVHNFLVHSDSGLTAVFIAVTLGVKRIALRNRIPFVLIQLFKILDVNFGILASRKPNPPKGIAVAPTAISKRNGNEPISQRRTDYKIKLNGNYNFDGNTGKN